MAEEDLDLMVEKDLRKILLDNDYSKLLSYLAGVLVFFFMLFEISKQEITSTNHPYFVFMMSGTSLVGVLFFLLASYHNYEEILEQENWLKISGLVEPSFVFSKRINKNTKDREISPILKSFITMLAVIFYILFLYTLNKVNLYALGVVSILFIQSVLIMQKRGFIKYIFLKAGLIE